MSRRSRRDVPIGRRRAAAFDQPVEPRPPLPTCRAPGGGAGRAGGRPMIIAIEGVSCTGKSTLAAGLAAHLGWEVIDCYHHVADDPTVLGEPIAGSEAEQLAALAAHLDVEKERCRLAWLALARRGGVILDRSIDTLLAHLYAIGRLQHLDATAQARAMVAQQVGAGAAVVPDLTVLLTAGPAVLADRASTRPGLPSIYYDAAFAEHFNRHFAAPVSPRCVRIDSAAGRDQVLDAALAQLALAGAV